MSDLLPSEMQTLRCVPGYKPSDLVEGDLKNTQRFTAYSQCLYYALKYLHNIVAVAVSRKSTERSAS